MIHSRFRGLLSEDEQRWRRQFSRKLSALGEEESLLTAFLDPHHLSLAEGVLREKPDLSFTVYGGYPGAERVRLRVFPAAQRGALPDVACVLVTGRFAVIPEHRDFLGAVLGLGLRRDQIGDILLLPGGEAALMVLPEKEPFICANLTAVGSRPVECMKADPARLPLPEDEGKEVAGTVASLRLDSVLSLGFGLSRSRVVLLIKGGLVKVNWRPVESPSRRLDEGDLISLQGRGRLRIVSLQGETRKGRTRLVLKKTAYRRQKAEE